MPQEPKVYIYKGIRGFITPPERQEELPEDERVTPEEWRSFMRVCMGPIFEWEPDEIEEDE